MIFKRIRSLFSRQKYSLKEIVELIEEFETLSEKLFHTSFEEVWPNIQKHIDENTDKEEMRLMYGEWIAVSKKFKPRTTELKKLLKYSPITYKKDDLNSLSESLRQRIYDGIYFSHICNESLCGKASAAQNDPQS